MSVPARLPHRLGLPALLTTVALAAAACSGTPSSASSEPSAAEALAQIGITSASLSVEALDYDYVLDDEGVTYLAAVEAGATQVTLVRALWDGTEAWRTQVPVAAGASATDAQLSSDLGLGIVSVWFTAPGQTGADSRPLTQAMVSSAMTYYDVATGTAHEIDLSGYAEAAGATASESSRTFIGAIHYTDDDSTTAITYLTAEGELETIAWLDLLGDNLLLGHTLYGVHQWKGQVVASLTPLGALPRGSATAGDQLYVGRSEVAAGLDGWRSQATREHYVVYDGPDTSEAGPRPEVMLINADATTNPVEVPACTAPEHDVILTDGDHAYVGALDVDLAAATATCLDDITPDAGAGVAGGFSDGAYLFANEHDQYWIVKGDGSRTVPLNDLGVNGVRTKAGYLVTEETGDRGTTLRAYRWSETRL